MPGKKIQLSCEIGPLECIKGKGKKKKRHKVRSIHKNLLLTGFWCREGQAPESGGLCLAWEPGAGQDCSPQHGGLGFASFNSFYKGPTICWAGC